jgi:hypothetical protein
MDESTDGVTLYASFVLKVVEPFREMERLCTPLFEMVEHLRQADPNSPAPISLYNDACAWIEGNLGAASVRAAGQVIGRNAFTRMRREGAITLDMGPAETIAALTRAVRVTIQDPRKRGWELLENSEGRVLVRRTQTFNCVMQEGVLLALIEGTRAVMPRVEHVRCTRTGDDYCEYEVRWLPKRATGTMTAIKP